MKLLIVIVLFTAQIMITGCSNPVENDSVNNNGDSTTIDSTDDNNEIVSNNFGRYDGRVYYSYGYTDYENGWHTYTHQKMNYDT